METEDEQRAQAVLGHAGQDRAGLVGGERLCGSRAQSWPWHPVQWVGGDALCGDSVLQGQMERRPGHGDRACGQDVATCPWLGEQALHPCIQHGCRKVP